MFKPEYVKGDRVIHAFADDPRGCLPAMHVMFGTVDRFEHGMVFVHWDCDTAPSGCALDHIRRITPAEEEQRSQYVREKRYL